MPPDTLATVSGIKRILWKVALLLVLVLGLFLASPSLYRQVKIFRYNSLADAALKNGDLPKALFFAKNVQYLDPDNDKAIGFIARISVETGQPSTLLWLARWTELNPRDPSRLLALGKWSLSENQLQTALTCLKVLRELEDVPPVELAELESGILVKQGKTEQAVKLLKEVLESPTAGPGLRLNYGILLLTHPETEKRSEGVALLKTLMQHEETGSAALQNLIRYGGDHDRKELLREMADFLGKKEKLSINEYLLLMDCTRELTGKLSEDFIPAIREKLQKRLQGIPVVVGWLLRRQELETADRIIESYLPDKKVSGIVYPLYLHRLADKADWETIFRTAEGPEGKLLGVKRYIFLIQACRMIHQRDLTSQKDRFLEALDLDLRRMPQGIFDIDRLMIRWGWREERIRAWDAVRKADSIPSDFLKSSLSSAEKKGDTILLYGIGQMLLDRYPEHKVLTNNVITYSLLLDVFPEVQLEKIRKLITSDPEQKILKTTLALALIKNGQVEEALLQYDGFTEKELQNPETAAYYAMALLASGQAEKALPYLTLAKQAKLLPEELALLKQ